MSTERTLFDLPTDPEQFSVAMASSNLRNINFSALDFQTLRRVQIEYIKTYFADTFNDFVPHNGIMMLVELLAYIGSVQSLRTDILAGEGFITSARSLDAVINHLALIGQKINRATPATLDVECSVEAPVAADIRIPAGLNMSVRGDDGTSINYEVFSAPNDLTSDIIIPAGKRAIIAFGIEGTTKTASFDSDGSADQTFSIFDTSILEAPITVSVTLDSSTDEWDQVTYIETANANSKSFEARLFDGRMDVVFGNNIYGSIPLVNSTITVSYRTGGGVRGRIGVGAIDIRRSISPVAPLNAQVPVTFRNLTASVGGTDVETIEQAKKRAPRSYATHSSAVTADDYAQLVSSFSHPVFGTVSKSIATIRTSKNANLVEFYILAEGVDSVPTTPSEGLKRAIKTYITDLNVATDDVSVLDGLIKPVDVQMTVVVNKNSDASVVKVNVDAAIRDLFALANFEMGQSLYVAQLYKAVNNVDGVVYVDIFKPVDNILSTKTLGPTSTGVAINELITLGDLEISYYYEP